jgi:hypothetical protein
MAGEWKQHGPQSRKGPEAIIKLEAKRLPILCKWLIAAHKIMVQKYVHKKQV